MGKAIKIFISALAVAALLLLNIFPVMAEEPEPIIWEEADSFSELCKKLDGMRSSGGRLRLTANITVPKGEKYEFVSEGLDAAPVELDLGSSTITVEGTLTLQMYMNIHGDGGEKGLFMVKEGGWLALYSVSVKAASSDDYAIRQEDGAVLLRYNLMNGDGIPESICEGKIEPAEPIAIQSYVNTFNRDGPFEIIPLGEPAKDHLPIEIRGDIVQDGKLQENVMLPVEWNTEASAESFAARERSTVFGSFMGIRSFAPPLCQLAFDGERPITLLRCWSMGTFGETAVSVDFSIKEPMENVRLEWSPDGEAWNKVEEDNIYDLGENYFYVGIPTKDYPIYLSIAASDADGNEAYSDIVIIPSEDSCSKPGGNRGGGTDLGTPELPPTGGENIPPEIANYPDNPDTSSAPEPSSTDEPIESEESITVVSSMVESSPTAEAPAVSQPPAEASALMPEQEQATIGHTDEEVSLPSAAPESVQQEIASTKPEKMPESDKKEIKPSADVPADLHIPKNPPPSAKAVTQMVLGATAMGGIVTITITWKSAVSRFKRLFKLLFSFFSKRL